MTDDLQALLIPPQEAKLRDDFDLNGVELELITSGWHRLVIAAPGRVFVFPRDDREVPRLEREADVLSVIADLDFAPRLLGRHDDQSISRYPFLEMTRIEGTPYDATEDRLSYDEVATCLEGLGRRIAQLHDAVTVPPHLAARPAELDNPRVSNNWTRAEALAPLVKNIAESLRPYHHIVPDPRWIPALLPVATMKPTAVHGETSGGNVIVDKALEVAGLVDWDGLHRGHPLLDLDFGVAGYRICHREERWVELREQIWRAYATERQSPVPDWQSVNLFWSLRDVATVLEEPATVDARLDGVLADLSEATEILHN